MLGDTDGLKGEELDEAASAAGVRLELNERDEFADQEEESKRRWRLTAGQSYTAHHRR